MTVHEKFGKAFASLGAIRKASKNSHHGYAYRGIDDVMNALHAVLAEHGLFYVPRCVGQEYEEWQTSKGGRLQVARLSYEFVFYADDGTNLRVGPVVGQSADTDDKAPMQALSQAAKFALLNAFCVPTQDMGEADAQSAVAQAGGRTSEARPSAKQVEYLQSLLDKAPADKQSAAREWIAGKGGMEALSKRDVSTAIERLKPAEAA